MWNLPKGEDFLPNTSLKKLEQLCKKEKGAKQKTRLLCAVHRKRGESLDAIADAFNIPRITVFDCLHRFVKKGLNAKESVKQSGRPPLLTKKQRKQLIKELERGPPRSPSGLWTTKQVRELVHKKFKVQYVPQHVWRILRACGFSLLRPRPRHYKSASAAEVKKFKKKRIVLQSSIGAKGSL